MEVASKSNNFSTKAMTRDEDKKTSDKVNNREKAAAKSEIRSGGRFSGGKPDRHGPDSENVI